ncbi:non-classical export protein [Rutstroemia sp. NJR-2017a WRK4]|nr:non-classical export protein [Rutstroemia sp. NJR-2017a WRK4]
MIVTLALRGLQVIFAGVVLALSAILIKDFGPGHSWSLTSYGAFCGGASILIALGGVAACFVDSLQGIIMFALDGIAAFFLLAGGIAYAATIKVGNCNNLVYLSQHENPFSFSADKTFDVSQSKLAKAVLDDITTRCRETQASTAFLWFLAACFVGTFVMSLMGRKRGSNSIA